MSPLDEVNFIQSRFEVVFATALTFAGVPWEYEPMGFSYQDVEGATRTYYPDFLVRQTWVEIRPEVRRDTNLAAKIAAVPGLQLVGRTEFQAWGLSRLVNHLTYIEKRDSSRRTEMDYWRQYAESRDVRLGLPKWLQ